LGAILSYYLNKKYTFKSTSNSKLQVVKFFAVLFFAYILNLFTLQWLLEFTNPYLAQLSSAIVYTLSSFSLAKVIVFQDIK
jgi:putative flippase GtrA